MIFPNIVKILLISSLALTMWPLVGCKGDDKDQKPRQVPALIGSFKEPLEPPPGNTPEAKEAQKAELKKWNIYVDLSNELETTFQPAMSAYFAAYGAGSEYNSAENPMMAEGFRQTMGTPEHLSKIAEQAWQVATPSEQGQTSSNELDKAAKELLIQFRTLWSNLMEASKKLSTVEASSGGSASPAPATNPQVLHTKIYESYHSFIATHYNFQTILSQAALARRKRDIQTMKQDGLIVRSAMLKLIDTGQTLQNNLNSRNITSITLGTTEQSDLLPLFTDFQQSIDEFELSLGDPKQLDQEKLEADSLEGFNQQLTIVEASTTGLMARIQLQTMGEPSSDKTPGTPEHFAHELGALVDKYNSIVE